MSILHEEVSYRRSLQLLGQMSLSELWVRVAAFPIAETAAAAVLELHAAGIRAETDTGTHVSIFDGELISESRSSVKVIVPMSRVVSARGVLRKN